jgi:anti-sigma regulatory factor (Ser/Thr protein kinase)
MCATAFCGVLDPATGRLVYSSAGHPPGILTHPGGTTQLLEQGRSAPLAVHRTRPRPEATCVVPPMAVLLLYTDGLVERRRRPLDDGIAQAADTVRQCLNDTLEDLADHIMTGLKPQNGYDDDVALLLYRHPRPLEVTFPAESAQLAPVRHRLRTWLGQLDIAPQVAQNVLVAAGEACANAIEHGHRSTPGERVSLTAFVTAEDLHLAVTDTGSWRTPRTSQGGTMRSRGRGLPLIRALMQRVTIDTGTTGTTVSMRMRISG